MSLDSCVGKVTCSSEVNIADQCDQEWYLVHGKIHSKEHIYLIFKFLGKFD